MAAKSSMTSAVAPAGPLTPRALNGLKEYQYKSSGYTLLDELHTPFWDWLTSQLPMWLAPNTITLIGLLGVISSYLLSVWYIPDFVDATLSPHPWLLALNAIAVVVYVNLDCIDGKQARRTKSSSPLGQLFDHGCDALSVHLLLANTQIALAFPCGRLNSIMQCLLYTPWMLAHLEEYHSGQLLYGNGLVGILEANYALAGLSLMSAYAGEQMWNIPLAQVLPFLPSDLLQPYVLRHVFLVIATLGCLSIIGGQLGRMLGFLTPSGELTVAEKGNKQLNRGAVLRHMAVLAVFIAAGTVWTADEQLDPYQCRLANSSYGIAYALVATQLIMAHMAKEPFMPSRWAYLVVIIGAVNSVFRWISPMHLAALLAAGTLLRYLQYVSAVVHQVCAHLGIQCFKIKVHAQ
mmetsp:Transcript_19187/g.33054  ORF Transcript_19187/g.33054 Transcript_19187/m.33054 type:complete len:405 (-) Transcript_19187:1249-2463(-)